MSDTEITVIGNVVNSPQPQPHAERRSVTNFRIAATDRRFDSGTPGLGRRRAPSSSTSSAGASWAATCRTASARATRSSCVGSHPHRRVGDRPGPAQPTADQGRGRRRRTWRAGVADFRRHSPPRRRRRRRSRRPTCRPRTGGGGPAVDGLDQRGLRQRVATLYEVDSEHSRPGNRRTSSLPGAGRIGGENAGGGAAQPAGPAPARKTTEGSEAQWLSTSTRWSVCARRTATR